jgi:hypothetical protein
MSTRRDPDLERVLGDAIAALRSQLEKQNLGATTTPRAIADRAPSEKPKPTASRHIPSATKRAIVEKEGFRWSFVGSAARIYGAVTMRRWRSSANRASPAPTP